ncbi:MAG: tyrosine-type recombinase/integrase [Prevotella sp.]|nr:tyrosine-type recombinase/integrase [Prevotella sp.]
MDTTKTSDFKSLSYSTLRNYTVPVLHKTDKWYIDFKALDPMTGKMRRKKYYVKQSSSVRQRNRIANEMLLFFSTKLHEGWTPWAAEDYSASMNTFAECLQHYVSHVSRMGRKNTRDSYLSKVNVLRQYIMTQEKPPLMAYQFDTTFCCGFLDYIFIEKQDSARTRNNYRNWLFTLAEFFIMRNYIKYNPVIPINNLHEEAKHRKDLSPMMLERLASYLKRRDKYFYLACLMEYYTLIRPNELSYLRVGGIKVKNLTVRIEDEISKSGKTAEVPLNEKIIKLMIDLGLFSKPNHYFVFSTGCMPGVKHADSDQFNKRWKEVRNALGWNSHFQFYSLKDSGIRDLANAEGIAVARDQARHTDISTTNKYVQPHMIHECAKHFVGNL